MRSGPKRCEAPKASALIEEVATRVETAGNWRKSSYSGANGGECVEVARTSDVVMVRDTKDRCGSTLSVPVGVWRVFVSSVR